MIVDKYYFFIRIKCISFQACNANNMTSQNYRLRESCLSWIWCILYSAPISTCIHPLKLESLLQTWINLSHHIYHIKIMYDEVYTVYSQVLNIGITYSQYQKFRWIQSSAKVTVFTIYRHFIRIWGFVIFY